MGYGDGLTQVRDGASALCGQPIEAAVLVVKSPEDRGAKRLFGGKTLGSQLKTLNYLAVTPTHLRLFALGGRNGLKPKTELAAWPRGGVMIEVQDLVRTSFFASTGTNMEFPVHALRLTSPGVELFVDVMAGDPADAAVLGDGPAQEVIDELRRVLAGASAPS